MKKTKKIFILVGTMLMSVSLLAGCQPTEGEKESGTILSMPKEEKTPIKPEKTWVKVGERIPDTNGKYEFAGFLKKNTIAVRYYEDHETKTDYYNIWNREINIGGLDIKFGQAIPDENRIEILKVKRVK